MAWAVRASRPILTGVGSPGVWILCVIARVQLSARHRPVVFLTDFGLDDEFTGVCRLVIEPDDRVKLSPA